MRWAALRRRASSDIPPGNWLFPEGRADGYALWPVGCIDDGCVEPGGMLLPGGTEDGIADGGWLHAGGIVDGGTLRDEVPIANGCWLVGPGAVDDG